MAVARSRQTSSGYSHRDDQGGDGRASGERQGAMPRLEHEAGSLKDRVLVAVNKFNNDWTMNLVAMLSYNVLTSFFPLLLAILTILVMLPVVSNNSHQIAAQVDRLMPSNIRGQVNVESLLNNVHQAGGTLAIISIVGLIWGGLNLFGAIESCFAIIFRVKVRGFLRQKLMSLAMLFMLVVLLPISFVSSIALTTANTTLSKIVPGFFSGVLAQIVGLAASLGSLYVLFLVIYTVVPNIPVAWRDAWKGAAVAAVAMWVVNTIFPFYTAHFVSTKQYATAAIAAGVATIVWFWFFSLILLVGAQINSLAMGIGPWPFDLSRMLMKYKVPAHPGAPTALDAEQRTPERDFLPFSGIARDSQDVHDKAAPSAPDPAGDKDKDGR